MRKLTLVILGSLLAHTTVGIPTSNAASPTPRITAVSATGSQVTLAWASSKLSPKEFYEVEFSKTLPKLGQKIIKTKSPSLTTTLENFSVYKVRVRKSLAPTKWSSVRNFSTTSSTVPKLALTKSLHNQVEVTWAPIVNATSYEVTLDKNLPQTTSNTNFTFSGLKTGFVGNVSVRAISGTLKSGLSEIIEVSTLVSGPTAPVANNISTTGFTLTWASMSGASGYNVYRNKLLLGNSDSTSFAVTGQLPGSSNDYYVKAIIGGAETNASEVQTISTLVDTPGKLAVSSITPTSAVVTWPLDPNADSYLIYLYDSLGTTLVRSAITAEKSITSTTISGLTSVTAYTVGIAYQYGKITSKQSALSSFTTLRPAITGVTRTAVTATTATISWDALPSASTFEVTRESSFIAGAIVISTLSYTFTGLAPGQTYKFGVRATYLDGNKILSSTDLSEISVTLNTDPIGKPVVLTAPTITLPYASVPIVGATLSATAGTWTSVPALSSTTFKWQKSNDASTWIDITGATANTYVVQASDNGYAFRVSVTATNVNGTTVSNSSATGYTAPLYNVQLPITRGYLVVGQILEASDGVWSSTFTTNLSYQWRRGSSEISGAISPTYTLTDSDIGYSISVQVTGTTLLGSIAVTSATRGSVTIVGNTEVPVISGSLRVGSTLSVTTGTWLGAPSSNTYQWQSSSDGSVWDSISGATSATYVLKSAQSGLYIRAQVFGNKTSSASVAYRITATTATTGVVAALTLSNSVAPSVSGAWTEGATLTASTGTWSTSGTFSYQWQSSSDNSTWANIASATSSTYVLTSSEASKYVRVTVQNQTSNGDGIAYSVARNKVGSPYNTVLPALTGTLRVGSTQTVTNGTWSNTPINYGYQWQKSSDGISWINITYETATAYVPTFDVANLKIRVQVSAGNAVETATVTSATLESFLPPQVAIIPSVSGTTTVGQTLTSATGTWPSTSSGHAFQWQRSSDSGTTWTNISGATASTYVLVAADAGYLIRSQVSLTTVAGSSSAYSLPTAGIAP